MKAKTPGFYFQFYHWLVNWPWAGYCISLCLSLPIYKMGIICAYWETWFINAWKSLWEYTIYCLHILYRVDCHEGSEWWTLSMEKRIILHLFFTGTPIPNIPDLLYLSFWLCYSYLFIIGLFKLKEMASVCMFFLLQFIEFLWWAADHYLGLCADNWLYTVAVIFQKQTIPQHSWRPWITGVKFVPFEDLFA